ncbi:MAG: response regulator transcription factor [Lentisphaerae bacterium]|nr:response regulator transcription factor [Lentisphaerota bacterium]MBT4818057.1 response regulator transcription factor [Lentisphaerota bacterium]MBT5610237.1 response regulator transcription factor [Lentisphaerota bacterium]MBT7055706.1 response regulator transcription factor [Lentisphaerota bacterium]MBT7846001.1 response regulator transcription factor [Lentisphaerota bacterium]
MAMLKILLVDDHAVVRRGLRQILEEEIAGVACGEACDAAEALSLLAEGGWDVLILDITLPGQSGLDVLRQAKQKWPDLPVLVLSMHPEDQYALRVLKIGAAGYMTKETAPDELVRAIREVLDGGQYISSSLAEKLSGSLGGKAPALPHEGLSDREYEVLRKISSGQTVGQIADELCLSVKTISTYRSRVLQKMSMANNSELMAYALRHELVH